MGQDKLPAATGDARAESGARGTPVHLAGSFAPRASKAVGLPAQPGEARRRAA
jgi:hypothetical protein